MKALKNKKQNNTLRKYVADSPAEKCFNIVNILFLMIFAVIVAYPLYYVLIGSFSNANMLTVNSTNILLYPLGFNTEAYKVVLKYPLLWNGYKNTLIILVAGVAINMVMTMMGAYYLSRKDLLFKKIISKFMMFTMFFSGGMIPLYLLVKNIGLLDSMWSLILPIAVNTYNMVIMRSAFDGVPESLCEAAELDGANDFIVLWNIMVPACIPTIAVVIMYYAVGYWNSWFNAMIYISTKEKWPLQLVLRKILIQGTELGGDTGSDTQQLGVTIQYATIIVSTIPILLVYPFAQKYFVKGTMMGAVKG